MKGDARTPVEARRAEHGSQRDGGRVLWRAAVTGSGDLDYRTKTYPRWPHGPPGVQGSPVYATAGLTSGWAAPKPEFIE